MTTLVVDASVAVKWYLPEPHTQLASRLLEADYEFVVPDLFFPEIGNALWKRWRRGELTGATIADILEALNAVRFDIRPTRVLLPAAIEIAMEHRCSVYDSTYLALAIGEGARVLTADRKFHGAIARGRLAPRVLWIEDLP